MIGSGRRFPGIVVLAAAAIAACSGGGSPVPAGGASVPGGGDPALDGDIAIIRSATRDFRSLDAAVARAIRARCGAA